MQHECIPQAILGQDVICQAKSGMGKTAVFVLSTLQQVTPVDGEVAVLVVCHARELAFQISKEFERFSKYLSPAVKTQVFFGGTKIDDDKKKLATPPVCQLLYTQHFSLIVSTARHCGHTRPSPGADQVWRPQAGQGQALHH